MTFRQFAFRNVIRNKRLYAAFFFSSMFSVLVFFVYAIFAFHPALASDNLNRGVAKGLHTAEAIIYIFAIFFVLYSLSAFLKSRKKEFGLLMMQGMSQLQLRLMVFMENLLIGLFSTLGGIGLGTILSKAILMGAEHFLQLEQALPFYWPKEAALLTFGAFMLLFGVISLFMIAFVRGKQTIELIKGTVAPKSEPRASLLLSLLSAALLGGGYAVSILVRGLEVIVAFVPVTIAVIIGTYFLFTQLSVFVISAFKRSSRIFWKKTNMLTLADLSYRMKDNARTFFIISIVSTVAFTAIGSLIIFGTLIIRQAEEGMPFDMQYEVMHAGPTDDVERIRGYLADNSVSHEEHIAPAYLFGQGGQKWVVPVSTYNLLARSLGMETIEVTGEEAMVSSGNYSSLERNNNSLLEPVQLGAAEAAIRPMRVLDKTPIPLFRPYYIVADALLEQLGEAETTTTFYFWQLSGSTDKSLVGKQINELLESSEGARGYLFSSRSYDTDVMLRSYSVVLFVGLFIGVVFFIAAGSFLYFRLYQDLEDDMRKFSMVSKIGLAYRELSQVISRQMLLLFFAPVAVAIIHGAVALTALQNMFMTPLVKEAAIVLGSFLLVQSGYFLLARYYYIRRIRQAINV